MAYVLVFYVSYSHTVLVLASATCHVLHMPARSRTDNLKVHISILYLAKMIVLIL